MSHVVRGARACGYSAGAIFSVAVAVAGSDARADEPKRPLPDYAGRPEPAPSAGDVALWVPRVVFSPVYFVSEFLIRRPIGALLTAAERANLPSVLYDFFAFGPDHKAGFAPTLFVDFGFNPSVGLYGFWDDALFKGNDLRAHVAGWDSHWLAASLGERIRFRGQGALSLSLSAVRRPDHVFYGIGPGSLECAQSRYGEDVVDAGATAGFSLWRASRVEAGAGVRYVNLYDGYYGDDPSIHQGVRNGLFPVPPGFTEGYTAEYNHVHAVIDSRRPYPAPGSGVRVDGVAEQGNDFGSLPAAGWFRYQGTAAGSLDLDGYRRVLSLSLTALFSDPLGRRPVPFTELVSLGGEAPMPGFFPGRLVDRSAAAATLHYRWPIGPWLSGSMEGAVGNVFGKHLDDFDSKLLRASATIGVESDLSADSNFEIIVGVGTETFKHGGQVDSFRLAFGTSRL